MKKVMVAIPQEELVDEYCPITANKLNLFMDLQEFKGISYKTMYQGKLSKASSRVTIGYYVSKTELADLVKIAQDYRELLREFVTVPPQDSSSYRERMQEFIDKSPFAEKTVYKTQTVFEMEYKKVKTIHKKLKDLYLRYSDLFIDNPF